MLEFKFYHQELLGSKTQNRTVEEVGVYVLKFKLWKSDFEALVRMRFAGLNVKPLRCIRPVFLNR